TEAQWEKAARGTDGRKFAWGNEFDPGKAWASKIKNGDAGGTTTVGYYGVSPYGLTDMAGNAWQWCRDWYDGDFWRSQAHNWTAPENQNQGEKRYRVIRGGSWSNTSSENFRTASR